MWHCEVQHRQVHHDQQCGQEQDGKAQPFPPPRAGRGMGVHTVPFPCAGMKTGALHATLDALNATYAL
ncbi:MAG: hypothetical protein OHK0015_08350 [Chloroflexi bacterium OHK40]